MITSDDDQLRQDEENICEKTKVREEWKRREDLGEHWNWDEEEWTEVDPCLPTLLREVRKFKFQAAGRNLTWIWTLRIFVVAQADQACSHTHQKHWWPEKLGKYRARVCRLRYHGRGWWHMRSLMISQPALKKTTDERICQEPRTTMSPLSWWESSLLMMERRRGKAM